MPTFSQRHGHRPIRAVLQKQGIDDLLRTALWNAYDATILQYVAQWVNQRESTFKYGPGLSAFFLNMWANYFKMATDALDFNWTNTRAFLRHHFFHCQWYDLYDLIEFVALNFPERKTAANFCDACNIALTRELSGYRVVNGSVIPNTSEEEIAAIEQAQKTPFSPVQIHLGSAIQHLSNRTNPDHRNSIKESISAVEALCSKIAGKKGTLADALNEISNRGNVKLHPALTASFIKIYSYTSDAEGIRHALMDEPELNADDSMFMLVSCSAFINYLSCKATQAGIPL
jgi:hypothetical protein